MCAIGSPKKPVCEQECVQSAKQHELCGRLLADQIPPRALCAITVYIYYCFATQATASHAYMAAQVCCNSTLRTGTPDLRRTFLAAGLGFFPTAPELEEIEAAQVLIVWGTGGEEFHQRS